MTSSRLILYLVEGTSSSMALARIAGEKIVTMFKKKRPESKGNSGGIGIKICSISIGWTETF